MAELIGLAGLAVFIFLLNSFLKHSMMVAIPVQHSVSPAEKAHLDIAFRVELYVLKSSSGTVRHK